METKNSSVPLNMTNAATEAKTNNMEIIGGLVCFAVGVLLLSTALIILIYILIKKRRKEKKKEQEKRHNSNLKDYHGKGNDAFEYDDVSIYGNHVGLPLPTSLPPAIFSVSSQQNHLANHTRQVNDFPLVPDYERSIISPNFKESKRHDSNSSSDGEGGVVSLHRTSPLAAIYLIYEELHKQQTQTHPPGSQAPSCLENQSNNKFTRWQVP